MPSTCVVPCCHTGKAAGRMVEANVKASLHRFPSSNVEILNQWKSAIPIDWISADVTKKVICSLHFEIEDFETESKWTNGDLKKRLLKRTAIPTLRLESIEIIEPKIKEEAKRKNDGIEYCHRAQKFLREVADDNISNLSELKKKLDIKCIPNKIRVDWMDDEVQFLCITKSASGILLNTCSKLVN
uniref:THAP-type domain-containing protein n=1 Tax=Lepeophtheirus salmonis TaxID=72036 RepID=A0A0K2TA59_LEPSM